MADQRQFDLIDDNGDALETFHRGFGMLFKRAAKNLPCQGDLVALEGEVDRVEDRIEGKHEKLVVNFV